MSHENNQKHEMNNPNDKDIPATFDPKPEQDSQINQSRSSFGHTYEQNDQNTGIESDLDPKLNQDAPDRGKLKMEDSYTLDPDHSDSKGFPKFHAPGNFTVHYHQNLNQKLIFRVLTVLLGSATAALGMNLFLENAGLLPAGFVGLAKLIQRIVLAKSGVEIPFFALNILFNIGPAIYVFLKLGKRFAVLSILSLLTTSILLDVIPIFHLTNDMFLSTVMSGVIVGFSYVLIYNADASGGGLDFISMSISNKYKISVFNYVMIFNFSILAVSAFFFSLEAALYSIVYQFITTQIINRGHLRYQRKTCFIVTEQVQPLADDLMRLTHHGITVTKATGCYSGKRQYLLYMVVSRSDVRKIRHYLRDNAPHTFLNITDSEQLNGNFYLEPID